jgi:hypothetical protein
VAINLEPDKMDSIPKEFYILLKSSRKKWEI